MTVTEAAAPPPAPPARVHMEAIIDPLIQDSATYSREQAADAVETALRHAMIKGEYEAVLHLLRPRVRAYIRERESFLAREAFDTAAYEAEQSGTITTYTDTAGATQEARLPAILNPYALSKTIFLDGVQFTYGQLTAEQLLKKAGALRKDLKDRFVRVQRLEELARIIIDAGVTCANDLI
jgi:hypothetical protein|tara:strand:- start:310 stop:852 length:543 start_codon:yes stop_codon:yes gene_type:complete